MERGHIILLCGAVLIVAGVSLAAVWGVSFASSFVSDNTLIGRTTINPGDSFSVGTNVNRLDRAISLTVAIEDDELSSQRASLRETVTGPSGANVSSQEFGQSFVTTFQPQEMGVYTANIINLGTQPVTISGTFGYLPFFDSDGDTNLHEVLGAQSLGIVIAGGLMTVAGVVALIVGGVITVADSKKRSGTTTSSDGVTYRKD